MLSSPSEINDNVPPDWVYLKQRTPVEMARDFEKDGTDSADVDPIQMYSRELRRRISQRVAEMQAHMFAGNIEVRAAMAASVLANLENRLQAGVVCVSARKCRQLRLYRYASNPYNAKYTELLGILRSHAEQLKGELSGAMRTLKCWEVAPKGSVGCVKADRRPQKAARILLKASASCERNVRLALEQAIRIDETGREVRLSLNSMLGPGDEHARK